MLTLTIAVVCSILAAQVAYYQLPGTGWATLCGAVGFLVPMVALTLLFKRKFQKRIEAIQHKLQESQQQLQRQASQMQAKAGPGAAKSAQKEIEKKQNKLTRNAIEELDATKPYYKWNLAAKRQVNTLKGSFYYQIGEFEQADECFKSCLAFEPMIMAMLIARAYKNGNMKRVKKLYKRGTRRFRKENGVLIYALYSWILVQESQIDEAIDVLAKGINKTENETLQENWKALTNNRIRHFSNAGLGEQWYALQLEMPKRAKSRRKGGRRRK